MTRLLLSLAIIATTSSCVEWPSKTQSQENSISACLPWAMQEISYIKYTTNNVNDSITINKYCRIDSAGHLVVYCSAGAFQWHHTHGTVYCALNDIFDYINRLRQPDKENFRDYLGNQHAGPKGMFIFYTVDGVRSVIRYDPANMPPFLRETVESLDTLYGGGRKAEIDLLAITKQVKILEDASWKPAEGH